jgi:type II secretion system protein C
MRRVAVATCLVLALLALGWLVRDGGSRGREPARDVSSVAVPTTGEPTAAGPAPARSAPEPEEASLPYTKLPLRLVATVVRENPALSLATVEDLERTAHQVMSEGQSFDAHPKATLVSIERGRVILDNDGVREQLVLDHSDRAPLDVAAYEITPEQRAYRRDLARRLRDITDAGEDYLGRGERTGLLAEGDVSPFYEGDELVGVRIDNVRPDGLYDRYGIRNGDVVTSINGIPLGSPTAAAEVLSEVALSDVLEVEVLPAEGNGPPEVFEVPTEALQALDTQSGN